MFFLDRIASALAPAASDEQRADARRQIEALAAGHPFVEDIVRQHKQIEQFILQAQTAAGADAHAAVRDLAMLLNAHAQAKEAVVYPEISSHSGKTHAGMGYEEHAMAKVELAELQKLQPGTKDWTEKLDHIESAVQQHVYQEESSWLPDVIRDAPLADKERMNLEYRNCFERFERA